MGTEKKNVRNKIESYGCFVGRYGEILVYTKIQFRNFVNRNYVGVMSGKNNRHHLYVFY